MALPETCCHKKLERITCNKKSSLVLAFWKMSRAFPRGREERCCYFSAKKPACLKTWAYELHILRTVSGSALNLLNKSCHISHKTFSLLNLGFPEADPETVHTTLESVSRKNQQGCGQVGNEKEENHAEVYFMESNSGWVLLGNCGDTVWVAAQSCPCQGQKNKGA